MNETIHPDISGRRKDIMSLMEENRKLAIRSIIETAKLRYMIIGGIIVFIALNLIK